MTQPLESLVALCAGGVKDKAASFTNIPFDELAKLVTDIKPGTKDGPYFLRAPLIDVSKGRSDENTYHLSSVLIIDADGSLNPETGEITEGAPDPAIVHNTLQSAGVNHLIYRSWSHGIKGNRYRILFFTDRPYSKAEIVPTVEHALHLCGGIIADVSENHRWSQPWYLPRTPVKTK